MKKIYAIIILFISLVLLTACNRNSESYSFSAQYIRTNGYNENTDYPIVTVIRSRKELKSYYRKNKKYYDLERKDKIYSDTTGGFLDACDKYTDEYFETNSLILILLEEGSGSNRHEVQNVYLDAQNSSWEITIDRKVPEIGTCDMAEWHIFLEIQEGNAIRKNDKIDIILNDAQLK